jgi:hypothetical protein
MANEQHGTRAGLFQNLLPVLTHASDMTAAHRRQVNGCHFKKVQQRIQPLLRILGNLVTPVDRCQWIRKLSPPIRNLSFDIKKSFQPFDLLADLQQLCPIMVQGSWQVG